MANQTLNPFAATPKETKKQTVEPVGGKMGFFDETENYFDELENNRFLGQENFNIEPAAVVAEAEAIVEGAATVTQAEAIIQEAAAVSAAENIIREAAQAKPTSEPNVIFGEYQGSLTFQGDTGTFIEQTQELKIETTEPREISISPQDQKELFAGLVSAGADTLKDAANKAASTAADTLTTAAGVTKDMVVKDIMGLGGKEKPKTAEEIEKANKAAEQRAHEQKFQGHLTVPHPEVSVFELDNKVVSKSQLEEALDTRLTSDHIDEKGRLKANKAVEGAKALDDKAKLQEKAAQRANTLAMATKGKGMGYGELEKGVENPNHPTKATG